MNPALTATSTQVSNPRLLILDKRTRDIDVGAKVEITEIVLRRAFVDWAFLLVSSEHPEVVALSKRSGGLAGQPDRASITPEAIKNLGTVA